MPLIGNMCLKPKWIYKKGNYKESNYRGQKGDFYEIGTYTKCGCCTQCIAEKANNWVIRNHYESKANQKKCFITLTYAETSYILVRKDLVDWVKRFRFEINKEYYKELNKFKKKHTYEELKEWKIKHESEFIKTKNFYVGEYGSKRNRPHFHVIIYGWEDENVKYLDVNKRGNILYQSKIIQDTWGLGRTTYQKFNDREIPYIALYNTANEEFKKAYKLTREKAKQLRNIATANSAMKEKQRLNLFKELGEWEDQMNKEKAKYMLVKEFNGWSIALGWEQFENEYIRQKIYTFEEYIENKVFVTPTPWIKKLANQGDIQAAEEMFRRERELEKSANEEEERMKNESKIKDKRKKELKEWQEWRKNMEIDEL